MDLILTNDEFSTSDICFKPPLKGSDHSILVCKYRIPFYNSHSVDVYLYPKINDTLVDKFFYVWKNKFTLNTPIEQLWNNFRSMYDSILSCVPRKRIKKIKGFSYLNKPCFKLALKEKYKLWLIYTNSPNQETWFNCKSARNKVAHLAKYLRRSYENSITQQFNTPRAIKIFFN